MFNLQGRVFAHQASPRREEGWGGVGKGRCGATGGDRERKADGRPTEGPSGEACNLERTLRARRFCCLLSLPLCGRRLLRHMLSSCARVSGVDARGLKIG